MNQKKKRTRHIPIIIAISIIVGIFIGTFYANRYSKQDERTGMGFVKTTSNKLNGLLHIIDNL